MTPATSDDVDACEMQTTLLQTSADIRVLQRNAGDAISSSGTESKQRAVFRRRTDTSGHAELLEADAAAMAQASLETSSGSLRFGPYSTERRRAFVGDYPCGSSQHANVYLPVARGDSGDPGTVPVISFAHGHGMGGPDVGPLAGQLLPFLASWGFVVIAHESELRTLLSEDPRAARAFSNVPERLGDDGRVSIFCDEATFDQIRSLEWANSSEIADRIDWASPTGVAGYSMGGTATLVTALNAAAVEEHNIGAAFSLAPYFRSEDLDLSLPLQVPTLLATGELDTVCPADESRMFFDWQGETTNSPRIFASVSTSNHVQVLYDEIFHTHAAALFRCHLRGEDEACGLLYGDSDEACDCLGAAPCTLCSCLQMSSCVRRDTPSMD